ncbi:hypothetical protein BDW62DRAFT_12353 [Aspergillus aurantiobrunneus]
MYSLPPPALETQGRCPNKYCKKYLFPRDPFPKAYGCFLPCKPGTGFATSISEHLFEAGIPNILWGTGALHVLGVSEVGEDTQFVLPDHLLNHGIKVIADKAWMTTCPWDRHCPIVRGRGWPVPDVHFHINNEDVCLTLDLFRKSRLLWTVPDFRLESPGENDPTFTLASRLKGPKPAARRFQDRRVPFHTEGHPVQILTPVATVNALIYLCLRDFGTCSWWRFWAQSLCSAIWEALKIFEQDDIEPCFRPFVSSMFYYEGGEIGDIIRGLRKEVGEDIMDSIEQQTVTCSS